MKKSVKIGLAVVSGLIVLGAIGSSGSRSNTQSVPSGNTNTTNTSQVTSSIDPAQEKITIRNSVYQTGTAYKQVVGEVTNNDSSKHSMILKATFYDADGKILGTATGAVNDLAPSETKTFNLLTNDNVDGYEELKVQVDSLF